MTGSSAGPPPGYTRRVLTGRTRWLKHDYLERTERFFARYGGKAPERVGLKHPTITPYGAFTCADGRDIVISIQNEREWAEFCREVLREPALLDDPRCAELELALAQVAQRRGALGLDDVPDVDTWDCVTRSRRPDRPRVRRVLRHRRTQLAAVLLHRERPHRRHPVRARPRG